MKKFVVIVSDAFRYEMAEELMERIAGTKHVANLSPMLAMLPTETKYCKPSLLPHNELRLVGNEMSVDGKVLTTIDERTAQLRKNLHDAACISYKDVMNYTNVMDQRPFFKEHPVVYIFHNTIDDYGHIGNVTDACAKAIDELATLVERLHASWNVVNVFVTADHGFLYNDITFAEKDKNSITEANIEKKTRYYLTIGDSPAEGIVKFPLAAVSSIKAPEIFYVATPEGTNRLAAPGGYEFAHGGASLQEMVVPLIYSRQKRSDKTEKVGVALMDHNLNMVSSRLKFRLIQSDAVSMNLTERTVVCQIFDDDKPVSEEKKVVLNSSDANNLNNRLFEVVMKAHGSCTKPMLRLKVWDEEQPLNPLITETVKNNTIIEQDF